MRKVCEVPCVIAKQTYSAYEGDVTVHINLAIQAVCFGTHFMYNVCPYVSRNVYLLCYWVIPEKIHFPPRRKFLPFGGRGGGAMYF